MKKYVVALTLALLMLSVQIALADTPTPTPTLTRTPVPFITPTSQYADLLPTPTEWVIPVATAPIEISPIVNTQLVYNLIQGYRMANVGGFLNLMLYFGIIEVIISILFDIADSNSVFF